MMPKSAGPSPTGSPSLRRAPRRRIPSPLPRLLLAALLLRGPVDASAAAAAGGGGGAISLTPAERRQLAALVESDPEARKLYQKVRKEADSHLGAAGNPAPTLHTAGRVATDPEKIASKASLEDMKRLHALGYTFAVTGTPAYAEASRRIILAWARVNQPTGLPIDETKLEPLLTTYDLTRSTFSSEERSTVDDWLRRLAQAELRTGETNSVTSFNNWNSHRVKLVGLIGLLLEDKSLSDEALRKFRRQIEANLKPDGSSYDFHERDALHYHCYDLEPLLALAIAARRSGLDLYHYESPSGSSLAKSVAFLLPYCDGTKTHAEWVHSNVKFDRTRAEAGEKGFTPGELFQPREARATLELASAFDPACRGAALRLQENGAARFAGWTMVVNKVREHP